MSKTTLNLVVAACNNRGIGKDGQLPWRIRKDMDFFKKITMETKDEDKKNAVIMGRKTWFSIPEKFRPLAKRINIILSREMKEAPPGVYIARGLDEAINLVNKDLADKVESICIIGGSSVYKEAMESDYSCRIFLTKILADFECDTFLPEYDENLYKIVENYEGVPQGNQTENDIDFVFEVYEKITEDQLCDFDVLAAMCSNRGIGYNGKLPWPYLEKDVRYYKQLCSPKTKGKCTAIIKGRKTWEVSSESMKSDPGYVNIVISKLNREQLESDSCIYKVAKDLNEALMYGYRLMKEGKCERTWILGGQKVYEDSVTHPCCKKIYLTEIYDEFPSDTFFPLIPGNFIEIPVDEEDDIDKSIQEEVGIKYKFRVFKRSSKFSENQMCDFNIMTAMCSNRGIGFENKLPWPYLEKDVNHYRQMCSPRRKDKFSIIIYGRATWYTVSESEKTQQGWLRVVISNTKRKQLELDPYVYKIAKDLDEALFYGNELMLEGKCDRIWVLGGQRLYKSSIKHDCCKRIYVTEIHKEFQCDTFFPAIPDKFQEISGEEDGIDSSIEEDNGIQYQFKVYERMSTERKQTSDI